MAARCAAMAPGSRRSAAHASGCRPSPCRGQPSSAGRAHASLAGDVMSGRVIVAGAGAAGLTAALRAAEAGADVTVLNAHPKVGLKILMSGGTRCNVTHVEVTERDYNGGSRPFVAR